MSARGRHRCACRRELLGAGDEPVIEATSTVDRIRHTRDACEPYRTVERRVPPDGAGRPSLAPERLEARLRRLRADHAGGMMPEPPEGAPRPPRPWCDVDDAKDADT